MNKHFSITIVTLITASSCIAMNQSTSISEARIIKEITVVARPYSVTCFPHHKIVITGSNNAMPFDSLHNNKCSIYDFSHDKEIPITNYTSPSMDEPFEIVAAHTNKKLFAVCSETELGLYNIEHGDKLYEKKVPINTYQSSPAFNVTNDTLFICGNNGIDQLDYTNNSCISHRLGDMFQFQKIITHPSKPLGLMIYNYKSQDLSQLQLNNKNQSFITRKIPVTTCINGFDNIEYSPDGSLLGICHDQYKCSIMDLQSEQSTLITDHTSTQEVICSMAFNPMNFILITLSCCSKYEAGLIKNIRAALGKNNALCKKDDNYRYCIEYINAQTKNIVATTHLPIKQENVFYPLARFASFQNRISFFHDGTKIIVALNDKCVVLEVPFEAQYQPDTKEKCTFALWVLKNYKNENGNLLPEELTHLLTHNLLKTCKYSLTNY